ncbi:tyrosine-type recombinase/integrase [Marinobacterium sedimentorum]|uniref:tyrosine-type recombinase/integrase n=1 Tax=Marinobacterium sedimentorum TaxID=2927804 RepID=UPI0020C6025E|nr:site-specific integrase [Marinobacterium sedimentorum]MCP8687200.1 tyrosine-type recombinase/integrase [Marinobacterium sedimentorum]
MATITDRQINAKPDSKDRWLNETVIRGHGVLVARITPSGQRSFYFRYTNNEGRRDRLPIGSYSREVQPGYLTLTQARLKAKELAALHQSGLSNIREQLQTEERQRQAERDIELVRLEQESQTHRSRRTVTELFEHWAKVDLVRRKDKGAEMRRLFTKEVFPLIGSIAVEDIRRRDITNITDTLLARGVPRMAKVTLSSLRQMFRFAVVREILDADPTAAISKTSIGGPSIERDRILSDDEIRQLKEGIPNAGLLITTETAVWICFSTCCRIGELLAAEWRNIDLRKQEWLIPAENSKNGKPHTVYLSSFAMRHFEQLHNLTGAGRWCYPNRSGSTSVCSKTITKQLTDRQRPLEKGPMSGRSQNGQALLMPGGKWTPHDLRRTGATIMVASGVLPEVAERCLNHTEENKVKRTYQRHNYAKEMQEAWQILGQRLQLLTENDASHAIPTCFDRQVHLE